MDAVALTDALDSAIQKACGAELGRLVGPDGVQPHNSEIIMALNSLGRLSAGVSPNYNDPWVALFYLSWYQPGQVMLAFNLIEQVMEARAGLLLASGRQSVQVIDFGCGALALQFGLAIALDKARRHGQPIESVRILAIDESRTMYDFGVSLWQHFMAEIADNKSLPTLYDSCRLIRTEFVAQGLPFNEQDVGEERWLTAIHTFYRANANLIKEQLAGYTQKTMPHLGIMSGHNHSEMRALISRASPFTQASYSESEFRSTGGDTDFELARTTKWRRNLNRQLSCPHPFLTAEVTSGFRQSLCRVYFKRRNGGHYG